MKNIIEAYKTLIVEIATPYSTGIGFYLKQYNLIITNEHIVRDNREVVIDNLLFGKQMAKVVFLDSKHDLAFLSSPKVLDVPTLKISMDSAPATGKQVVAIGHPDEEVTHAFGEVTEEGSAPVDIDFINHTAAMHPGNSGGPLTNQAGELIGINTFLIQNEANRGFALPASQLLDHLRAFETIGRKVSASCSSCANLVVESTLKKSKCPFCNARIVLPSLIDPYAPIGVAMTIEEILIKAGHDVQLSRKGPNNWEIEQGSAHINISYYEKSGLIIGDAYLCTLPTQRLQPLYEFMLKQNYDIEGLIFSVKGQDIVLSLLIFDRYLNVDTGMKLFQHLFERADYYDNILVEEYGASWKKDQPGTSGHHLMEN